MHNGRAHIAMLILYLLPRLQIQIHKHIHVHIAHSRRAHFTARDNLQLNDFNALQRHKYYSIFGRSNEFVSDVFSLCQISDYILCLNACMHVGMYVCRRRRRSHRYSLKNKFFCEFQWYQEHPTLCLESSP